MTPRRWEQVSELFCSVASCPHLERAAILDRACHGDAELRTEVEKLLAADASPTHPNFLDPPSMDGDQMSPNPPGFAEKENAQQDAVAPTPRGLPTETLDPKRTSAMLPDRIGAYHIKRVIASGGMGTVYEATQDNPRRVVAVKVMKHGIASKSALRRFEYEGQILGRLRHPGIAQIYEAGTHHDPAAPGAPVPYFAMEYIPNAKLITQYADEKKLGTRHRMELFSKVCDAIHHGHQKGIIHRDLKPSNILVDSAGQVKIIDFGVARCTDSDMAVTTLQTDVGQLIGTLQYMSPEQCEGDPHDIDTRSDVYALGVVFYQLLCGKLPYDVTRMAMHQATRAIREQHPTKLSTLNKTLRGDVETIALKALEKERERRYQSAADLGHDIHRYLTGEAILARRASIVYQLRLFARRNKAVFASLAAVFIVLVAGIIVSTSFYVRAQGEAQRAKKERDKAERIASFMGDILKGAGPSVALGRDATMLREMLDVAANRIDKGELKDSPEAELQLRLTVGQTYNELGAYEHAWELIDPSVRMAKTLYGEEHPLVAASLNTRANGLLWQGKKAEGELLLREALAMKRKLFGNQSEEVAVALRMLAVCQHNEGNYPEAERLYREALAMQRKLLGEEHLDVAGTSVNLARLLNSQGRYAEAERLGRESLAIFRKVYGEVHPGVGYCMNYLAGALAGQGNYPEAERLYRETLEINRKVHGEEHPAVPASLKNLASVLERQGNYQEAERLYGEALAMRRKLLGEEHPEMLSYTNAEAWRMLTCEAKELRNPEAALGFAQRTCALAEKGGDPKLYLYLDTLALAQHMTGDTPTALQTQQRALTLTPKGDPSQKEMEERLATYQASLAERAAPEPSPP